MKQVERLIPEAMPLIAKKLGAGTSNRSVPSVFKGYISSMGASIILSGLIPTLAFYDADTENSGSEKSRRHLLCILHELLKERYLLPHQTSLLAYALTLEENRKKNELRQLQRDVMTASVAVKLALRSFEMTK